MTNKKSFLRNILATASTFAMALGPVDVIAAPAAAPKIVTLINTATNIDLKNHYPQLNGARNIDAIKLVSNNTVLNVLPDSEPVRFKSIAGIDINNNNSTLNVGASKFDLGSVVNTGDDLTKKLNVVFNDESGSLFLNGRGIDNIVLNDYSALGSVNFGAYNKAVYIEAENQNLITINSNIGSFTHDNTGKIVVNTNSHFTGNLGENYSLNKILIRNNTFFSGALVKSLDITINPDITVTFGASTDAGTRIISQNGIVGLGPGIKIKIQDKAVLNTRIVNDITLIEIQDNSEFIVNNQFIEGAAIIKTAAADKGKLTFNNVNTHANIGEATKKLEQVTFSALNNGIPASLNHNVHALTLNLSNGSKLILNDKIKTNNITSDGHIDNLLELVGDYTINFNIGEDDDDDAKDLNINFTSNANNILTLGDVGGAKQIYGNITNEYAKKLTVRTGITNMSMNGKLGEDNKFLAAVEVGTATEGHKLILANDVYAPVKFMHSDSEIEIFGNMYDTINGNSAASGKILVAEDIGVTFNKAIGDTYAIKSLTIKNDSEVFLKASANFDTDGIRLGKNSDLTICNIDITLSNGANIQALDEGQGRLTLNKKNTPGVIGAATKKLEQVTFSKLNNGAPTSLNHNVHALTLDLTSGTNLIIDSKIKSEKVTSSDGRGKLVVANPYNINFNVGVADKFVEINFVADKTLVIEEGKSIYAKINSTDNSGTLCIKGNATLGGKIGNSTAKIKEFRIKGDNNKAITSHLTDIYADKISHGNAKLVLGQDLSIYGNYEANGSTIDLGEKALTFDGKATFKGASIINLTLNGANYGKIARNDTSEPMVINPGATIQVNVNVIKAPSEGDIITFINTGINATDLTNDKVVFSFTGDMGALEHTVDGIVGKLKFILPEVGDEDMTAEITDELSEVKPKAIASMSYFEKMTEATSFYGIKESKEMLEDSFEKFAASKDTTPEKIEQCYNDMNEVFKHVVTYTKADIDNPTYVTLTQLVADHASDEMHVHEARVHLAITNTNIEDINYNDIVSAVVAAHAKETTQHKAVSDTSAAHAAAAVTTSLQTIALRTSSVVTPSISNPSIGGRDLQASTAEGIAAGSGVEKYGVWGQVMSGLATQKARKGASGFKSSMIGSIVGSDTMINDHATIGFAFGNIANNVKMQDIQKGDKTRSSSWIFSGYGDYQFDNNFFIRGSLAYTKTGVSGSEKRIITAVKSGVAQAKYNINSFGGEFMLGKLFALKNFTIIPSIGGRFTHTGKISYQENGDTGLNAKISQGLTSALHGLAGLQVAKSFFVNESIITSEAHANLAYGLGVKSPKGKFTSQLDNKVVSYIGNKPSRFSADIGCGITTSTGAVEYGIGYDASISSGYVGHYGTLKLRVKF